MTVTTPDFGSVPVTWEACVDSAGQAAMRQAIAASEADRIDHTVYPPRDQVFTALHLTPPERVKVVLVGQDPYHAEGQAHGLCFSVPSSVKPPPSLRNIFRELHDDLGCPVPTQGDLTPWAERGVLLLNTVLTVREGAAGSHRGLGWETFTDAVIRAVSEHRPHAVFLLWGQPAQRKQRLINTDRHIVIAAAHPSPLSARRGFFGSHPFSRANASLEGAGLEPIDWCIEP